MQTAAKIATRNVKITQSCSKVLETFVVCRDILENCTLHSLTTPAPWTISSLTHRLRVKHREAPSVFPAFGVSLLKHNESA